MQMGAILLSLWEGTKEYLALEYRKKEGIDAFWGGIPSEGLLIYKIDDSVTYRHRFNSGDKNNHYAVETSILAKQNGMKMLVTQSNLATPLLPRKLIRQHCLLTKTIQKL